jgi:hypothetical protein
LGNRVDSVDQIAAAGLFFSNKQKGIRKMKICREWIKIPIINHWKCKIEEKQIDLENNVIPQGSNNINEDIFENELDEDIFGNEIYEDIFGIELDQVIFDNAFDQDIFEDEYI